MILLILIVLFIPIFSYSAKLNLENEYTQNYILYSNLDLNNTIDDLTNYAFHRFRCKILILEKEFQIGLKLQSLGIVASTSTFMFKNYEWEMEGFRFVKTDFTPFVEEAYIKINNVYDKPLDITLGRQKLCSKTGLLIDDNSFGLDSLKLELHYPKKTKTELFLVSYLPNFNVFSIFTNFQLMKHTFMVGALIENDSSGISYPESINVNRSFYEFYLEKETEKVYYSLDVAFQNGNITLSQKSINSVGLGCLFKTGLKNKSTPFGPSSLNITGGIGSGDDKSTENTIELFKPTLSRRFDGLKRVGVGKFFSATLYDAFLLPQDSSGLIFGGFTFDISPKESISLQMGYFSFYPQITASEKKGPLGTEFDLSGCYKYSKSVEIKLGSSFFFPGKEMFNIEPTSISHFFVEFIGKF